MTAAGNRHWKNDSAKKETRKKKGPLALASGPSLGRKRPRRAAIARGATAPQQYAAALHKVQGLLNHFQCKRSGNSAPAQKSHTRNSVSYTNNLRIFWAAGHDLLWPGLVGLANS